MSAAFRFEPQIRSNDVLGEKTHDVIFPLSSSHSVQFFCDDESHAKELYDSLQRAVRRGVAFGPMPKIS